MLFNILLLQNNLFKFASTRILLRTSVHLSFKVIGEGSSDPDVPPIFLLHGLLSNKKHWKAIGKTILNMTKRPVLVMDLRNHGGSPHTSSHKFEEMADDLIYLLDRLSIDKATLVGHGMGGRAAMALSLFRPHRVAGLIIIDTSPVSTPKQLKYMYTLLTAMKGVDFKLATKISQGRTEALKQLKKLIDDDIVLKDVLSNINVTHAGKVGWTCNLDTLIKHFNYIESFPSSLLKKTFNGPCLFIGGQRSHYIPPDDLPKIRDMFPKAVITYIPNTGHNVYAEDPKTFLEIAIAFIRTN